jgi:excisionase family DNA binding protein
MSPPAVPNRRYFTLAEASAIANLSTRTLRRAIEADTLDAHRIGRLIRLEADAFYRWVERQAVTLTSNRSPRS